MTENTDRASIWLRVAFVIAGLAAWFGTQRLIGERESRPGAIHDGVHVLLEAPHRYLHEHRSASTGLLIVSSAVIDAVSIFLLLRSVFGPTVRPFLGLLMLFAMRQICQLLCALEPPQGMIWYYPGFPSLLVTYSVATDFFFSGHTGLAVLGGVELSRWGGRRWQAVGVAIAIFEATTVLVLRAHYTMDVFTGAVAARYASILAARVAPSCDRFLARLGEDDSQLQLSLGGFIPDTIPQNRQVRCERLRIRRTRHISMYQRHLGQAVQPREVSQAFLKRIPISAEVLGKVQTGRQRCKELPFLREARRDSDNSHAAAAVAA